MRRLPALLLALVFLAGPARAQTTTALLDTLQHTAFNFFWNEVNPANGLIRDRDAAGSTFCSIASVGFGLSAIPIGVDHGWVTRAQGRSRVRTTLNTFYTGPQGTAAVGTIGYRGFFYHFLNMNTATRFDNSVELWTRGSTSTIPVTRTRSRSGPWLTRSYSARTGTSSATSTPAC